MEIIIYLTIYFIITSLLGWYANRPDCVKSFAPCEPVEKIIWMDTDTGDILSYDENGKLDKIATTVQKGKCVTGINIQDFKRLNEAVAQMGFNFKESERAILKLSKAMEKAWPKKTKSNQ